MKNQNHPNKSEIDKTQPLKTLTEIATIEISLAGRIRDLAIFILDLAFEIPMAVDGDINRRVKATCASRECTAPISCARTIRESNDGGFCRYEQSGSGHYQVY